MFLRRKLFQKLSRPLVACEDYTEDEKRTIGVFKKCSPSVVHVTTQMDVAMNWFEIARIDAGSGSGFVWDTKGHIVTNYHVIRNATRAKVTLQDHTVLDAELVGVEPDVDIAVLRVKSQYSTPPIPVIIGKSQDLQVGQKVFAIGNPFGLDQSLSEGVVSGLGRQIEGVGGCVIKNVIQTDAAINPGNSGGPLLDGSGKCIGINTMIASSSGGWSGIGFAVPSATIVRTVSQIIQYGKTIRPWLGVSVAPASLFQAKEGVVIVSVQPQSPAAKAGLRGTFRSGRSIVLGDQILEIDGHKIMDADQLFDVIEGKKIGDTLRLKIKRDSKIGELSVVLKDRPLNIETSFKSRL